MYCRARIINFLKLNKQNDGFSLAELMMVVAVMGIVAAIAVPGFLRWLPDYYLKSAARDLFSNMQLTRIGAIKNSSDWAIVFDTTNNRYLICSDWGADNSWSGTGDNTIEKAVNLTGDLSVYKSGEIDFGHGAASTNATEEGGSFPDDEVSFGSNVATFNSRGTGSAGYTYFDNKNDKAYAVGKTSSGSVRCVRWADSEWK